MGHFIASHRLMILGVLACGPGCGGQPHSYDDCILKYVKPGMQRDAVGVLMQSCRQKFPQATNARPFAPWELGALTGRAGLSSGNTFSGDLYNGNDKIRVTELEVEVTATAGETVVTRTYRVEVSIPPRTADDFLFSIVLGDQGSTYSWRLLSAKGTDVE